MRLLLILATVCACSRKGSAPKEVPVQPAATPMVAAAPAAPLPSSAAAPAQPDAGVDPDAETKRMVGEWQPVVASILVRDYERNGLAADGKYKGKKLSVVGIVREVSRSEITNAPAVILDGGDMMQEVRGIFPESEVPRLSNLETGELVALHCTGDGVMLKSNPQLKDCSVAWDGIRKSEHLTEEQRRRVAVREARSGELCLGEGYIRIGQAKTMTKEEQDELQMMISTARADLQKLGMEPFPCPPVRPLIALNFACEDATRQKLELAECATTDVVDVHAAMQH